MQSKSSDKFIKLLKIIFIVALVLFVAAAALLLLDHKQKEHESVSSGQPSTSTSPEETDGFTKYPDKVVLGQSMNELALVDETGAQTIFGSFNGKYTLVFYWGSYCPHCKKELDMLDDYLKMLSKYPNVQLVLLDKTDGTKETKDQALAYLKQTGITYKTYFDQDIQTFKALGVKIVPTLLGIDQAGQLKLVHPGEIGGPAKFEAMIQDLLNGPEKATEQFVVTGLTDKDGGVHVNYLDKHKEIPSGFDILSESQGIMMDYAVRTDNHELFDRYYRYVQDHMMLEGKLVGWVMTADGLSKSTALVDDLRIFKALYDANVRWGGYDEVLRDWPENILKYNTDKGYPVNSYDFKMRSKASQITLCFADLEAFRLLSELEPENDKYTQLYNNALSVVSNGYLGNGFPLYASAYDIKKNAYSTGDLNMAEEMVTLLHLAQEGQLKNETVIWLNNKLQSGGIKARYTTDGHVSEGYNYESTAIYATVIMIARELGDSRIMTDALFRMEQMRQQDVSSKLNGAFGDGDVEKIFSYDQCMALLAYAYLAS